MKKKSYVLLLTATIKVEGMSNTVLIDSDVRAQQYKDAIFFYLKTTKCKIVFCENSGTDISDSFKGNEDRIEFLTFQGNNYDKSRGKGLGEIGIFNHVLKNSQFIKDNVYVVKITGRFIFNNIESLIRYHSLMPFKHKVVNINVTPAAAFCDSRFFICSKDYLAIVVNSQYVSMLDERNNFFIESMLVRIFNESRSVYAIPFIIKPQGNGVSGTTGYRYMEPPKVDFKYSASQFLFVLKLLWGYLFNKGGNYSDYKNKSDQKWSHLLFPHGGSGNHGCEAIVRSTQSLLGRKHILFSSNVEEDKRYGLDRICLVKSDRKRLNRMTLPYWKAWGQYHLLGDKKAFDREVYAPVIKDSEHVDYVLGIGGDNYCYDTPEFIYLVNRMVDEAKVKRILWGASVEPEAIDERMLQDLRGYHKIWARESLTYEALLAKGLTQTFLLPDPAFVLDRKDLPLPDGFVEGNTVGINVSPMIIGYEKSQGMALQNYVNLVRYIVDETDMQVALIPHVVWSHNDDRKPLTQLYDMFKDTGRVVMIEDHNAMELKGYIARCRFMVVARTHASIAAYSTQVPTLVVGYSVKARGIAKDIFGTEENYVLPVQSLTHENELVKGFQWMMDHEADIKTYYAEMMPNYIEKVYQIRTILGMSKNER